MTPQLEELACLYALDRLDPAERASFEARLPHDAELAALVRELESTVDRRIRLLPRHEPPPDLLARIEARIDRLAAGDTATPARKPAPLWTAFSRWGIAALFAIGLGAATFFVLDRNRAAVTPPVVFVVGLDSQRSTFAALPLQGQPGDHDARFVQLASLAEKFWDNPGNLPSTMDSAAENDRGYALFDPDSRQGFIAIRQLPARNDDKRYHLWIVDTATGQALEAGVIPLTAANRGLYFFSVAPGAEARPGNVDFFVTAEDPATSQPSQPRGQVVLGKTRI